MATTITTSMTQSMLMLPSIPIFKTPLHKYTYVNLICPNNNINKTNNNLVCNSINNKTHHHSHLFLRKPIVPRRVSVVVSASLRSSSSVTLEKPKPKFDNQTHKSSLEGAFQFDDASGGGNGNNKVGGGDNGGGGFGDDDDYFDFDDDDEDDGGEGGWFRRRITFKELYDRVFIESVLNEWQKTLKDLPDGMRLACELGAISSAQLVKYLMNEARPTITRAISRNLSKAMSRAFIGRITADPAFLHKLLFEQLVTIACSINSELKQRGERIRQEWDLALTNVLTVSACNLVVVWSLAPCCSYANTSRSNLQNTLYKLPNNIFEGSYRHRQFDVYQRFQSFVYKAVKLSLVGFTAGAVQTNLSNLCARNKEGRLSVQIPPANTNALGYGAFVGLYTNWRYQLLCGMDIALTNHFDVIGMSLFLSAAFRVLNAQLGEISRAAWVDTEPPGNSVPRKKRIVKSNLVATPT